jgi:hypothetical protein
MAKKVSSKTDLENPAAARSVKPSALSTTPASFTAATIWNSSPSCPTPAWI